MVGSETVPRAFAAALTAAALASAGAARADAAMDARIEALAPDLEAYIAKGMAAFDDPGLAIGIVSGDRLVYAKGFGVARKGGAPVDADTIFQIGSTTKAFLATTLAIGVDRGLFAWDDRVVDRYARVPAEGSLGQPGVPRLRPARPALRPAALCQRHAGLPRRRPGRG